MNSVDRGLAWQIGVWDRMVQPYERDIDRRFAPVVDAVISRARLKVGDRVLDLGTGTGSVAVRAASLVGPSGQVIGTDISPQMLIAARERVSRLGLHNTTFVEGRAEAIPGDASSCDAVLASLSLMFVIDRAAAAREIARVLRPGGRFVAAVWSGAADCDLVRFQEAAGRFAPAPPVAAVGPGALADTGPFVAQLADAGITAVVEREVIEFDFENFEEAWEIFAGVTATAMTPETRDEAKATVRRLMWAGGDGPRRFRNATLFVVGTR